MIVWYAGLPFDPAYGVATLRHLKNPTKYPQPKALDHSAIGFSWYRDGKVIAYALNGFKAEHFRQNDDPFSVEVSTCHLERDPEGYRLKIETPSVEGKPILGSFRFTPAPATEPFERDLGTPEAPHNWLLAASDCRVEGHASFAGEEHRFVGRGYHDHNAGAEDLSIAMKRWQWGRVHHGDSTEIYYVSEPKHGTKQSLWITCREGRPEWVVENVEAKGDLGRTGNAYGLRHHLALTIADQTRIMLHHHDSVVDDGPFYRRWIADFYLSQGMGHLTVEALPGIAELLDTRNLHKPWFNWMIPYRLKWPKV